MKFTTDDEEIINLYNNYKFVKGYERYLINTYNNLLDNRILITDKDSYKLNDNIKGGFTDKKRIEANKYILTNYLYYDMESLNNYNKIIGNPKNKLCGNLEAKKQFNKFKWYNKAKLIKQELKNKINKL